MKVYLLAPNYCWHTSDLLYLSCYENKLEYIFIPDTPPFISRNFYKKYFFFLNISYEFFQRLWRLLLCLPWSLYLKIRLHENIPVHCHGLFSLFIARLGNINTKRIVFTPQGSDLLILPDKNILVKKFLSRNLHKLGFITADSELLLKKSLSICSFLRKDKLKVIQNGVPIDKISKLINSKNNLNKREIDICWIRGLEKNYQFKYFLLLIKFLSKSSNSVLNIAIISAYGSSIIPKEIFDYKNIKIKLLPRLDSEQFLSCIFNSKVIISIPLSDSSPRSVYESIFLGCKLFLTDLECLNWIPSDLKSDFIYTSGNLKKDAKQIIAKLNSFEEINDLQNLCNKYPDFCRPLNYREIAQSYLNVFRKIK